MRAFFKSRRGSVLIIVLAFVTLITVLVVGLLMMARYERMAASLALNRSQAEALANYTAATAVERLREAIDEGRKPPSGGAYSTWASEPGRIHVFNVDAAGAVTRISRDMFSAPAGAVNEVDNVDLNKASYSRIHPITGTVDATMKVGWTILPTNPDAAPSKSNPAFARVAYWVDDDSCKVNVNTADGSAKNDSITDQIAKVSNVYTGSGHYSYGFGTPSEISLQAFPALTKSAAANIADYAMVYGFNSAAEVVRAPEVPADFYQNNKFSLTARSKSPEVTIFGEPRIGIFPVVWLRDPQETRIAALGGSCNYSTYGDISLLLTDYGTPAPSVDSGAKTVSGAIDFVYPQRNQLPGAPMLYAQDLNFWQPFGNPNQNQLYALGIVNALSGTTSTGAAFTWPSLDGGSGGFSQKYSARQLESLALQIYDLSNATVFTDQRPEGDPYRVTASLAPNGLSNTGTNPGELKAVMGVARGLKLTEVFVNAIATSGTTNGMRVPRLQLEINLEFYYPKFYEGMPLHGPYTSPDSCWIGHWKSTPTGAIMGLNMQDLSSAKSASASGSDLKNFWNKLPRANSGFWQGNLLRVNDQTGNPAGVDLMGGNAAAPDPDQGLAALYHPYTWSGSHSAYMGGIAVPWDVNSRFGVTNFNHVKATTAGYPGTYRSHLNTYYYLTYPASPTTTEFRFEGGLSLWASQSGPRQDWETVPLDSWRGGPPPDPTITDPAEVAIVTKALIPVQFSVPVPGMEDYHVQVADPLVNKFPGDWIKTGPQTMQLASTDANICYMAGGKPVGSGFADSSDTPANFDGDNSLFKPSGGGDPLSVWMARLDIRYPKQSRFPSLGALNYIRTGIIPDDLTADLTAQKGTPWRSINFSKASASSQTVHGVEYPDWVMLDLFTVPFLPQKPYRVDLGETPTPIRKLTAGGATEGKLNLNNPLVPYPFGEDAAINTTPPLRPIPLQALFYGIKASTSYADSDPIYSTVDATALASAVQTYLVTNGPFMLPGQVANVEALANYTYAGVDEAARSRNDVFRQIIGATTTQSNTYSIWVVTQTFKKAAKNADYSKFEPGDIVTGEVRRRYVVERHIEPGLDGVPGNAKNPGFDAIVGTADDPIDPDYHPAMTYPLPYRWRIALVEDVKI